MKMSLYLMKFLTAILSLAVTAYVCAQDASSNTTTQDSKGALLGAVTDLKGKALAGATVSVNNGAEFTQSATTDGQGLYALPDLSAGNYVLSIVVSGSKVLQTTIALNPSQVLTVGIAVPDSST